MNTQASRGFWWKLKPERFMRDGRTGQYVALSVFIYKLILPFHYYSSLERNTENAESLHRVSIYLWRLINISCRRFLSFNVTTKPLGAFTIPSPTTLDPWSMGCHYTAPLSPVNRASKQYFEINRHLIYEVGDKLDLPHTSELLARPSRPALTAHQ